MVIISSNKSHQKPQAQLRRSQIKSHYFFLLIHLLVIQFVFCRYMFYWRVHGRNKISSNNINIKYIFTVCIPLYFNRELNGQYKITCSLHLCFFLLESHFKYTFVWLLCVCMAWSHCVSAWFQPYENFICDRMQTKHLFFLCFYTFLYYVFKFVFHFSLLWHNNGDKRYRII